MQKHDLTLQTVIEIFEKMGKKKKIEKNQKYFMFVWARARARAQFLKFCARAHVSEKKLRSRSQPDERALRAPLKWAALTKALVISDLYGKIAKNSDYTRL